MDEQATSHNMHKPQNNPDPPLWLNEVLEEVGLQQFYPKLINDLQLTKLSHFDFVSEDDLIQLGLSRPAARRLLAAIKKKKSFVTALKNRIVNKLMPTTSSSSCASAKQSNHNDFARNSAPIKNSKASSSSDNSDFGRLSCLINTQDILIKEEIGHGVHGFVKKGEWTTPNGRVIEVALKILKKDVMAEPGASFNDFVKEISVMHQLNHTNIIKLYGVVLSSPMMMVTELAPFGNLRDKLRSESGRTPVSQLINFGVQIACGMQYLESMRFVHRDLAARNIFISHGKKILIGDLGLMRIIPNQEDHYVMSEKTKIPYPWCAPESLRFKQFNSASDVYMFGVTLWEMFSFGREPWAGLNLNEILENITSQKRRLPCPDACPTMVYQTLLQCWNTEPSHRPNFSTLYQYLSTSYPLEVRSTQNITDTISKRATDGTDSTSQNKLSDSDNQSSSKPRKVMSCCVEDRILVIDGQPEEYWWKGQNQRTFEIGWFPLSTTRWLAPKRSQNFISKPLKNSFIHTGHCGPDGKWGNPKFIDSMYLKNPLDPDDLNSLSAVRQTELMSRFSQANWFKKDKNSTKSRLSRLFGINETAQANHILTHAYQRFCDETNSKNHKNIDRIFTNLRSQSDQLEPRAKPVDDEPPLIDFSDDIALPFPQMSHNLMDTSDTGPNDKEVSLLDLDISFPPIPKLTNRRSSDTNLDRPDDNYHVSWAGSWNTGTFYDSASNIYSAYYCPQDAASSTRVENSNRYYSPVNQEEDLQ